MTAKASTIGAKDALSFGDQVVKLFNSDRCDKRLFCDVTIQARNKRFAAHRAMLGLRSKFFEKLFTSEMKEKFAAIVEIDMDDDRLERILDYAYTGVMDFSGGSATDILEDAEYTELLDLKTECETFMFESVDVDNCLKLRSYALRYNLTQVANKSNRVIENNFAEIVQQDDFKQLEPDDLSAIVERRAITMQGKEVYAGIVGWVKHNPTNRRHLFSRLFSQLDLATLSSCFLTASVATETLVREDLNCSNAILDTVRQRYLSLKDNSQAYSAFVLLVGGEGAPRECVMVDIRNNKLSVLPKLKMDRVAACSVKHGNMVVSCGGADSRGGDPTPECEILNIIGVTKWTPRANMPEARKFAAAAILNGLIYVSGGRDANGARLSSCAIYDINDDAWRLGPKMMHAKSGHAMVTFQGSLFSLGGSDGNTLNTCERYTNNEWSAVASMNKRRLGFAAVVLNECIYAIGGHNGSIAVNSVEKYDLETNKWYQVRPMNVARRYHGAFASHGSIYVVGGLGEKSVEVYNVREDTWNICFHLQATRDCCNVVAI